ncbi:MAG: hypothetical protein QXS79_05925 [Candidatus Bathyarchaeia archaeon]
MEALGLKDTLKRIFIFDYQFDESKSLSEVRCRLEKSKFEIRNPVEFSEPLGYMRNYLAGLYGESLPESIDRDNALAVRSSTVHPTMIYFLFLQRNDRGGLLILFETEYSWYSYEKILHSMRAFNKNAGIKSKYVGLFIPSQRELLMEVSFLEGEQTT